MNNITKPTQIFRIGLILALAVITGTLVSCEDALLNKQPIGEQTSGTFFQTEQHAIDATNATYAHLRDFGLHSFNFMGATTIPSDDAVKGSVPADAGFLREMDEWRFNPGNNVFSGSWGSRYVAIQRANQAIVNIPGIEMDEDLKARLIGENKFLRSYFYFFLVRAFGGVPLITEPFEGEDFEVPRSTVEETYSLIEQDLRDAAAALPFKSQYSANDLGRATKGAAQGLLAKVHLFQDEYAEALDAAMEVINSNEYSLPTEYGEMFRLEGENGPGSIFEVQAASNETNLGGNSRYNQIQGARGGLSLGWGFNGPSADLEKAYEPGDPRQQETILFTWEETPKPLQGGQKGIVPDNPQMVDERFNEKAFITNDLPGNLGNAGGNIRRLRYADVLLIAAEAAYQTGNEGDARMYVNMVRERARQGFTATIGVTAERFNRLLADTTGLQSELDKPFIRFVNEQGAASSQGFEPIQWQLAENGNIAVFNNIDIIQSVDGIPVNSYEEYNNIMAAKGPFETIELEVLRVEETYDGGAKSRTTSTLNATFTTQELLPDITSSGQELLEDIWFERRMELAMEHHRLFDLRRQGRAGEVLRALGINYETPKHDLYPIPQVEIDNTGGFIEQNPGY
ncbi:MAG: RagB/SusD family nutrient uptake outer membrane protein [Bacteroidetes bacterium]|jgi:hypothetical protein|nr:RagB/SusD family nutrient uptake outer membrane protein [Bacteroidota bacterium]